MRFGNGEIPARFQGDFTVCDIEILRGRDPVAGGRGRRRRCPSCSSVRGCRRPCTVGETRTGTRGRRGRSAQVFHAEPVQMVLSRHRSRSRPSIAIPYGQAVHPRARYIGSSRTRASRSPGRGGRTIASENTFPGKRKISEKLRVAQKKTNQENTRAVGRLELSTWWLGLPTQKYKGKSRVSRLGLGLGQGIPYGSSHNLLG
jgi:hypothetical protein